MISVLSIASIANFQPRFQINKVQLCSTKQQAKSIQISQAMISWFYWTQTWRDLQKGELIYPRHTPTFFLLHGGARDISFRSGRGMGQNLQGGPRWAKWQFLGIFKQISMFCWCYYCLCKQIKLKFDSFLCFFGEKSFFFGGKLLAFQYVIGTLPQTCPTRIF